MTSRLSLLPLFALSACVINPPVTPVVSNGTDVDIVRSAIVAGGLSCGAGDPAGPMANVDRELVLSFPDAKDRGYDSLARGYQGLCDGKSEGTVETTVPEFEEIAVIGDVAVARMIWSTHLRGMPPGTVRKLRDFQVWRRTREGWRFWRGVHWPYSDGKPK